ncbi:MAG: Asparaginase [Pseudonocardiales bacterium]|nr:Asparaginase [Pseudonocardiales bacterium]MDT4909225.1 L-asparaginase [Pseudonocardiales bacterium]
MTCRYGAGVPRIAVFFLGGTISMAGHYGGVVAWHGGAELVAAVPRLGDLDVTLDVRDLRRAPSACLTFDDILELAAEAEACDADGVVVVQGTDTLEETSYLLDLVWQLDTPIVLTGAMRNPNLAGADGPANLLAAVLVAASEQFRGLGAVVVLNDEIHAARYVRKTHSTSPAAFASPNAGPIGHLVEGAPVLVAQPPPRLRLARPVPPIEVAVGLVTVTLDDDGALLADLDSRCDGLVLAGFGVGHVPATMAPAIGVLATRIPVVLSSRIGAGPVLSATYGFTGSESDLLARGVIGAGLLDPYKARVLLRVLLAGGADREAIAAAFAQAGGLAAG